MHFFMGLLRIEFSGPEALETWLQGPLGPWVEDGDISYLFHEALSDGAVDRPPDATTPREVLGRFDPLEQAGAVTGAIVDEDTTGFLLVEVARSAARSGGVAHVVLLGRDQHGQVGNYALRIASDGLSIVDIPEERLGEVAEALQAPDLPALLEELESIDGDDW